MDERSRQLQSKVAIALGQEEWDIEEILGEKKTKGKKGNNVPSSWYNGKICGWTNAILILLNYSGSSGSLAMLINMEKRKRIP